MYKRYEFKNIKALQFSKRWDVGNGYQQTVIGSIEDNRAVITKLKEDKFWAVGFFYYGETIKAQEVVTDYPTLEDAKAAAANHVLTHEEYMQL